MTDMTIPDEAVEAGGRALAGEYDRRNNLKPGTWWNGPEYRREHLRGEAQAALTAAAPHIRAQELREFIEEADASPAVTWGGHGGIKELVIRRHNRHDADRLAEGSGA